MIRKTGFNVKWVKWIIIYMANLKYQVLVNSDGIGFRIEGSERGIRYPHISLLSMLTDYQSC